MVKQCVYGQEMFFSENGKPKMSVVVVDVFGDEFAAEVYAGPIEVYEALMDADEWDEAHGETFYAYAHELTAK
jgi:hypothetical protein